MTLNFRGELMDFNRPRVMGILNLTPDSFYDGGQYKTIEAIKDRVEKMVEDGMDILDIGGMSSRPGAAVIPISEEVDRLKFGLDAVCSRFSDLIISVDSLRSEAVEAVLDYPIHMVNDISGGNYSSDMWSLCAKNNLGYVLMHMQGLPADMQVRPAYENVVLDVLKDLRNRCVEARNQGLTSILIDVGIGFGKTSPQNFQLLKKLSVFQILDCPVMIGLSRKSMVHKTLGTNAQNALNGTTVLHTLALQNGARCLRVHDVKEAAEAVKLFEAYRTS